MTSKRKELTFQDCAAIMARIAGDDRPLHRKPERIGIQVMFPEATIGPLPTVGVVNLCEGFDWDSGTMLITPERPLTVLTHDEVLAIQQSRAEGSNWHHMKRLERFRLEDKRKSAIITDLSSALLARGMTQEEIDNIISAVDADKPRW